MYTELKKPLLPEVLEIFIRNNTGNLIPTQSQKCCHGNNCTKYRREQYCANSEKTVRKKFGSPDMFAQTTLTHAIPLVPCYSALNHTM